MINKDGDRMFYLAEYLNFSQMMDNLNTTLEEDSSLYSTSKLRIFKTSQFEICPRKNGMNITIAVPIKGEYSDHFLYRVHEIREMF